MGETFTRTTIALDAWPEESVEGLVADKRWNGFLRPIIEKWSALAYLDRVGLNPDEDDEYGVTVDDDNSDTGRTRIPYMFITGEHETFLDFRDMGWTWEEPHWTW